MPNLDFFPEEVQECIKKFFLNKKELGLEFIESSIIGKSANGIIYEYIFKYKNIFYRFRQEVFDHYDREFEEECSNSDKDNMFTVVVPQEVTRIIYE
jgi:hypothetical protein